MTTILPTRKIVDINELDAYWQSKFQKEKNASGKTVTVLHNKIVRLKARARVDFTMIDRLRVKYPDIYYEIYNGMHAEGIKTKGVVRTERKVKEVKP